jgi:hypothetical protein
MRFKFEWIEHEMPASKSRYYELKGCPVVIQISTWNNDHDAERGSWCVYAPDIECFKFYPADMHLDMVKDATLSKLCTWLNAMRDAANAATINKGALRD